MTKILCVIKQTVSFLTEAFLTTSMLTPSVNVLSHLSTTGSFASCIQRQSTSWTCHQYDPGLTQSYIHRLTRNLICICLDFERSWCTCREPTYPHREHVNSTQKGLWRCWPIRNVQWIVHLSSRQLDLETVTAKQCWVTVIKTWISLPRTAAQTSCMDCSMQQHINCGSQCSSLL